mmetsp:Transcript_595/g.2001  ORF Transcript_595/g.2001 Transcript_595/m.2001 type:complete len:253 (-) Transcript_595:430-1188(-)
MGGGVSRPIPQSRHRRVEPGPPQLLDSLAPFLENSGDLDHRSKICEHLILGGGLGDTLRTRIWPVLLGTVGWELLHDESSSLVKQQQSAYAALLDRIDTDASVDESHARVIDADVPRTCHMHESVEATALRSVLLAHLIHAPDIGYFQGMSDAAAIFLRTLPTEGEAFWAFHAFIRHTAINWEDGLPGIWWQARAVMDLLDAADPKLAIALARASPLGDSRPLPFLFQPLLLQLKREMKDDEQHCSFVTVPS